jgi:predicted phosphodiesterase
VRVVCVSDTHNVEIPPSLFPPGDLLIHAGDHTIHGTEDELKRAATWLHSLAAHYTSGVVCVAGNHDAPLDAETWLAAAPRAQPSSTWTRESMEAVRQLFDRAPLHLLEHGAVEMKGLRLFGSPYASLTPRRLCLERSDPRRNVGFLREEETLAAHFRGIPAALDILITHGPPRGILDTSVHYGGVPLETPVAIGSVALRDRLRAMPREDRPSVHVFGHEHDGRGVFYDEELDILCINAAATNGDRGLYDRGIGYTLKENFSPFVVDLLPRSKI